MKIYTRTGDAGETGLFGGGRAPKHHPRIGAYGEVDALNAALGWCAVVADDVLAGRLRREMAALFALGAHLATPADAAPAARARLPRLEAGGVAELEAEIDAMEARLEPLQTFVLPGGCELAARLHVARCACRGAERAVTALASMENVEPQALVHLNRLSDWLFVAARAANAAAGVADLPWLPDRDA
ncbi:MAG TPA: cob(I)yrinic acid a,c-diamide adenosyltransferase [Planctomycetota bacterium]